LPQTSRRPRHPPAVAPVRKWRPVPPRQHTAAGCSLRRRKTAIPAS